MAPEEWSNIERLESQLNQAPDSECIRDSLLEAYLTPELADEPRRIALIAEHIRLYPRSETSRCPFTHLRPGDTSSRFEQVEREWLAHMGAHPNDAEIARGYALFLVGSDRTRALEVLRAVVSHNQHDAELFVDLGRIAETPADRLAAFRRARILGASQPNLLVWMGCSALDAGEIEQAGEVGRELLDLVAAARAAHGEKLDWSEGGPLLWGRACAACGDQAQAHSLVRAIRDHANRKHWGHTIMGVVGLLQGDNASALDHLDESAKVPAEPRLSSYGPSFRLARELAQRGEWSAVASYLRACRCFWPSDDITFWIADLEQYRVPGFPHR